ncbi:class V chitinase-like [Corylus avellana]|uniref:class V chitinase-like n=1 Tax=Corylus avellana TaxID=13451 RepID=UPI001E208307|nr:class V chitinase-like [Corylus avellana]
MASSTGTRHLPVVKAGFWYCRQAEQISISNCNASIYFTHLFCAYAEISGTNYKVTIPDQYRDTFASFTDAARQRKSTIKTLISIGGVDSDPATFVSIIRNEGNRDAFIQSSIQQARENNFDGLHLSWPCWKYQPTANDMQNLATFFRKWHEAVTADAAAENKEPLLLTATVSHKPHIDSSDSISASYPANAIKTHLDWINVRAYDFYNALSSPSYTAPPAALHNAALPPNDVDFKSVETGITEWLKAVPADKLVIGLPFVGYEWLLEDPVNHDLFDLAKGSAKGEGDGYISYRDVTTKPNFNRQFNQDFVTNYGYGGDSWIGYDDKESITTKIAYFKRKKLRGYFAWHVCADDVDWTLSRTASQKWDEQAGARRV